jgi:hypothetical protein
MEQQILVELWNIKFHKNNLFGSWAFPGSFFFIERSQILDTGPE